MTVAEVLKRGRDVLQSGRRPTDEESAALDAAITATTDMIDRAALEALEHALRSQHHERVQAHRDAHEEEWREFESLRRQPGVHFDRRHPEVQAEFWRWKDARGAASAGGGAR
jgi:hypothetical protein